MDRSFARSAIAALLAAAAALTLRFALLDPQQEVREAFRLDADVLASPGRDALALAAMEHASGWADLFWLGIVQELGRPVEGKPANWDRVERWANIAVDLDPLYFVIYQATAISLVAYGKRVEPADALLHKGVRALPQRWELPFLLGYNAYFVHGKPLVAADYWKQATRLPNAARFLPSLVARSTFQGGDEAGALGLLEEMLPYLDGPQKEDAEIRIKIIKSEPVLREFDAACEKFRTEHGRMPASAHELVFRGFAKSEPKDMLENLITLDDKCRARTKDIRVREDEAAKERIGSQGK